MWFSLKRCSRPMQVPAVRISKYFSQELVLIDYVKVFMSEGDQTSLTVYILENLASAKVVPVATLQRAFECDAINSY